MIIKIKKIHLVLLAFLLVSISFVFTIRSENIEPVSVKQGVDLPIIMYHHITEKPEKSGKYVVTTDELEKDFIYISELGYKTVLVDDLIKFSENKIDLPEKIIMITFDDGFKSVYKLALPLLEKYNLKAVVAPVGIVTEEYTQNNNTDINYSYMTWDELKSINDSPLVEVQSHTYNMHTLSKNENNRSGMSKLKNETNNQYKKIITEDLQKMQNSLFKNCGFYPTAIAYPYGLYSKSTLSIIKEIGFKSNFLCEERINRIYKNDKDSLYNLGRFNRPSGTDTEEFFKKMNIK